MLAISCAPISRVARIILGLARGGEVRSGFLEVPSNCGPARACDPVGDHHVHARHRLGGVSPDGKTLTLHMLDLRDEAEWIRIIKDRYERPLRRIFE